jgi:hypothetical protein
LSTWRISRSLGAGATYEGVTSVDKGAAFSATVTLAEGYEIGAAGVTITMGGVVLSGAHSISGNVITVTIASVTGNVLIKVPTVNTAGGDEPDIPDVPTETTFTIRPTPADASVILYDEKENSVYSTGETTLVVEPGTIIWYMVEASNHVSQSGRVTVNETKVSNITLAEYGASGSNIPLTWHKGQFYQTNANASGHPLKTPMERISAEYCPNITNNLDKKFWCTQVFTKKTLPNGSVISIKSGYTYRPDGVSHLDNWNTGETRPSTVETQSVTVDDNWWDSGKGFIRSYVGFSIGAKNGAEIMHLTEDDLNDIFSIKLPE